MALHGLKKVEGTYRLGIPTSYERNTMSQSFWLNNGNSMRWRFKLKAFISMALMD